MGLIILHYYHLLSGTMITSWLMERLRLRTFITTATTSMTLRPLCCMSTTSPTWSHWITSWMWTKRTQTATSSGDHDKERRNIDLLKKSLQTFLLSSHSGKLHSFTQGRIWKECKAYRVCRFQATQRWTRAKLLYPCYWKANVILFGSLQ